MNIIETIKKFFGCKKAENAHELPWHFESRLREDDLIGLAERSLGRQLRKGELNAIWLGFRPQGLLDTEDSYCFTLAPSRYKGNTAPLVEIYPVAVSGYVNGSSDLVLSEAADISFRDKYGDDHLATIVA